MTFCNFHCQLSLRRKGASPNSYDTACLLLHSADALGNITTNSYGFDANGDPTHTIYYPDGSMETDTQYGDGLAYRVTGTAVAGVEYDYGVDGNGAYTTTTKLDSNGNLTSCKGSNHIFARFCTWDGAFLAAGLTDATPNKH